MYLCSFGRLSRLCLSVDYDWNSCCISITFNLLVELGSALGHIMILHIKGSIDAMFRLLASIMSQLRNPSV